MCVCVRVSQLPIGCTAYGNLSVPRAAIGGLRGAENSVVSAGGKFRGEIVSYLRAHTHTHSLAFYYISQEETLTHTQ